MSKRIIKNFLSSDVNPKFGDYILFQEYVQGNRVNNEYTAIVSKPKLVIYLGVFVADQTLGFNYIEWINDNHFVKIEGTNYKEIKEVGEIQSHIEWGDYIDILGHWSSRPNWKEILSAYRNQNTDEIISASQFKLTK